MDYDWPDVLDFWFGTLNSSGLPDPSHRKRWFSGGKAFDEEIRQRFLPVMDVAARDELVAWRDHPEGVLAQIILLDQFSRNVHRGTPRAFDHDSLAMELCLAGIAKGLDQPLLPIFRAFFYMPFQHSEQLADQDHGLRFFQALVEDAVPDQVSLFRGFLESAQEHQAIIARFGRFPHRNAVLGRVSSEAELDYLRQAGQRFGQ